MAPASPSAAKSSRFVRARRWLLPLVSASLARAQKEHLAGRISKTTVPRRPTSLKPFFRSSVFLWRIGKSRPPTMGSLCSKQEFPTEPGARPARKYEPTNPSRDRTRLIGSANSTNQVRARGRSPVGVLGTPNSDRGSSQSMIREKPRRTAPRSRQER